MVNSDAKKAIYMAYGVKDDGTIEHDRIFLDATNWGQQEERLPDGPTSDKNRNLFANGPEGMLIFARDGPHLGAIDLGQVTSNCDWSDDGSVLYISADMYLLRIKTSTKGAGW